MIELGRHIEILLLSNDCVIVPDFGGFVAYQLGAHYDEEDSMWLPPTRTLGFNQQLRLNDSLLVQSYVNAYDMSYPDALRRVEDEVNELKNQLDNEGSYTLESIGTLSVNTDGNYSFEPCEAGILSPEFYGLSSCKFPTLKNAHTSSSTAKYERPEFHSEQKEKPVEEYEISDKATESESAPALLEFTDDGSTSDIRTIHIRMSWVRNTVAIAAAVIAFFVMATPIANSDLRTQTMSHLQNNILYKLIPQDTNMAPATPVVDTIPAPVVASNTDTKATEKDTVQSAHPYCIVLASHVKLNNAEEYVKQLKERGYDKASVYIRYKTVRVIYGTYQNEETAYQQLKKLNKEKEFREAWVYKKSKV